MNIDLFIRRPVLTWVLTFSIVAFGILGYQRLGVDQFPDMEIPIVHVTALLEGASPEVMEQDVTDLIEEELVTLSGVRNVVSTSGSGASSIRIEFETGTDIDIAAQDVRDKVSAARRRMPSDVEPPSVTKMDFSSQPVLWVPINSTRSLIEASEYVKRYVKPRFETLPGVAAAEMWGGRERAMRIWVDGEAMRARGLAVTDLLDAVQREHVEIPSGRVESERVEYTVKTDAEFKSVEELERLVVAWRGGSPVRLVDVARVEDGSEDPDSIGHYNGRPTVGLGIRKLSGANTVAVVDAVYDRVDEMRGTLPDGYEFNIRPDRLGTADFSLSIRESVDETLFALVVGAALAVLTVFVFLRRWRPTMIVAAAIPISLITTFGCMWMFGYTLNILTLLAMALAVGVVIDDAIVVLENIERHREDGEEAFEAASKGTREIAFAATAATVSIAVVFLPVVFTEGMSTTFLKEFGGTVATAVMVSLVVALTLTPMLAARMKPPKERAHGSIYHRLERSFDWLEQNYRRALDWTLGNRWKTVSLTALSLAMAVGFATQLGWEFFPSSDEGRLFVSFETPEGTRLDTTEEFLTRNEEWMWAQPEVAGIFAGVGEGGGEGRRATNTGMMFVMLLPHDQRERDSFELADAAREALNRFPGQVAEVLDMSKMMSGGYDFAFKLVGNAELEELSALADSFLAQLEDKGGYVDTSKSLKLGLPEIRVVPDREKAAALGVDARTVGRTIQAMVGGMDIATFRDGGDRFDIRVRLEAADRSDPSAINQLYIRGRDGEVIELRNLIEVETGAGPSAITRTNRIRSVEIGANFAGDKNLGEAMAEARAIADDILPDGFTIVWTGDAENLVEGQGEIGLAFGLAILVIYLVLAAQFESLLHPVTVMLALPLAMVGAMGGLWLRGMTLNLFSLIGIVLLMGLVTKNSILLIDYANQLRDRGLSAFDAMRTAAPVRMRPVLMTAFSMIFGVLPAAIGVGPGAETRAPMGVAVAAGMFSSTLLTLLVVPVFYLLLDDLRQVAGRLVTRTAGGDASPRAAVLR